MTRNGIIPLSEQSAKMRNCENKNALQENKTTQTGTTI